MYGDGFQEQRLWDKHGRPTTTAYRSPTNTLVRSQQLTYDLAENVASKVEATQVGSFTESYGYDALNRLTSSYGAGLPSKVYQYNAIGNLTFKTGAGTYTYPASGPSSVRPHAVSSVSGTVQDGITGATYAYDANGNGSDGSDGNDESEVHAGVVPGPLAIQLPGAISSTVGK